MTESIQNFFRRFRRDELGATMVEYGIMVALIAVVAIVAVQSLGSSTNDTFESVNTTLEGTTTAT